MVKAIKRFKNFKGQAMVETALILPIILILVFGIIEFGRIFNAYIVLSNASREGARYAVIGKTDGEITAIVNGKTSIIGTVNVSINPGVRTQGEKAEVKVGHDLKIITPILGPLISRTNSFYIEASTTMRVE